MKINSNIIEDILKYSHHFTNYKSDAMLFLDKLSGDLKTSEKIAWLLTYHSLNQQISPELLQKILIRLQNKYEQKIFGLPIISEKEIEGYLSDFDDLRYWSLYAKFTGIILSIGRMLRKYDFNKLFFQTETKIISQIISHEVFYMGQGKVGNKVLDFIHSTYSQFPLGLGLRNDKQNSQMPVPGNIWLHLIRHGIITKDFLEPLSSAKKIELINDFYKELNHNDAHLLIHAMRFYLQKNGTAKKSENSNFVKMNYRCQKVLKCNQCPFYDNCGDLL